MNQGSDHAHTQHMVFCLRSGIHSEVFTLHNAGVYSQEAFYLRKNGIHITLFGLHLCSHIIHSEFSKK